MTGTDRARELLGRAPYVLLTTFRRDRTPVGTPVWVAPLGDGRIVLVTGATTGKVKRLRRDPQVLVAPCSARGRPHGRPVDARAVVLDEQDLPRVERALAAKYGWRFRAYGAVERLLERWGRPGHRVAVAVDVTG
ncbi:PPOX class F420-dependent oxidoreductase [Kineococcus aurantiacus]|uniref:Pyridoxamine 5'-phosphate oxidase N-terminal domain-containing protein n=1 Tax=Kineococcus aurantiacus TaxID=37633 RepID=A0A7Y9ARW7_9ACTN|nr:hypothetical protein [Kineococcus aurantiacus]